MSSMIIEGSGTNALLARSIHQPKWGSYLGVLKNKQTGTPVYFDAIGTGKEYRKLARAINLRFPVPIDDMIFELYAEHPLSGVKEKVLEQPVLLADLKQDSQSTEKVTVKELSLSKLKKSLRVNIYAEGYKINEKNTFFKQALKVVKTLKSEHFPGVKYMSFYAVFSPSAKTLDEPHNMGLPVPEFDSFLGLYYPYWDDFGRWYHVVYPTREQKFRHALAVAPYDYPIVLINNDGYWGVGNYMSHTAIPGGNVQNFTYLLVHEFGHFLGLNEEYEGGGRTELEFAAGIAEPWSQNMTFLNSSDYADLKWNAFVSPQTKLPTPASDWTSNPPLYGAYQGGYGDSTSNGRVNHKPGLNCVMESHRSFCAVCNQGILDVVHFDLGYE